MSREKWVPVGVAILFGMGGVGNALAKSPDMYPTERDSKYSTMTEYYNAIAQTLATPTPEAPKKAPVFPAEFTRSPNLSTAEMKLVSYTPDEIKNVAKDVHKVKTPSLDEVYFPTKALPYFWKFVMYQDKVVPLIWKTNMSKDDEDIEVGWVRMTDSVTIKSMKMSMRIFAPISPSSRDEDDWYNDITLSDTKLAKGVKTDNGMALQSFSKWIETSFRKSAALVGKKVNVFIVPTLDIDSMRTWINTSRDEVYSFKTANEKELTQDVVNFYYYIQIKSDVPGVDRRQLVSKLLGGSFIYASIMDSKMDPFIKELFLSYDARTLMDQSFPDALGTSEKPYTFVTLGN